MLVLTRNPGERIRIGPSIVLIVAEIEHGRVRLAFEAPTDVTIDREEIHCKRKEANRLRQKALSD